MAVSARGRLNSTAPLAKTNTAPLRPSTPLSVAGSVRSNASSVRQALATYNHASRVSGLSAKDMLSRSDQADSRRMQAGKNHTWRRVRRDFLPEIPKAQNAAQKKRATRTSARQKMVEKAAKRADTIAPLGQQQLEDTEYRREYVRKWAENEAPDGGIGTTHWALGKEAPTARRRKSELANTGLGMGGELRGNTTSRDEYPGHVAPPPSGPGRVQYKPSSVGMAGEPESRAAYKGGGTRAQPVRPKDKLHTGGAPLDGTTTSRAAYVPHEGARPSDRYVPPSTVVPGSRFVGSTETSRQFPGHAVDGRFSPQREREVHNLADIPFLGSTEYGDHLGAPIEDDIASEDSRGFVY